MKAEDLMDIMKSSNPCHNCGSESVYLMKLTTDHIVDYTGLTEGGETLALNREYVKALYDCLDCGTTVSMHDLPEQVLQHFPLHRMFRLDSDDEVEMIHTVNA